MSLVENEEAYLLRRDIRRTRDIPPYPYGSLYYDLTWNTSRKDTPAFEEKLTLTPGMDER